MERIFTFDFWLLLFETISGWIIKEFPFLILLTVIFFILLKLTTYVITRLKKVVIKRNLENNKIDEQESEKRITTVFGVLRGLIKIILWGLFVTVILYKLGVDVGPLFAGAGIAGLALGFGAQELVRDVISGFFILLDNQIRTGDVVKINGVGGLVEKIQLRTISLRDNFGVVHIFQNGKIDTLSNMTKEWSAMVFDIGISYNDDIEFAIKVIKQTGDDLQNATDFKDKFIEAIEIMGVDEFADSAVIIKCRIKTTPGDQWAVGREFRLKLKYAFDANKIEIPFPQRVVYHVNETK